MEVVVAFVIFAVTAAAVYEVLFGALRRSTRSSEQLEAWLVAQSLRDERSVMPEPWPAESEGEVDGEWTWRISTELRDAERGDAIGLHARDLRIEVWREGSSRPLADLRSVELLRQ